MAATNGITRIASRPAFPYPYQLGLTAPEREALLVALELAIAVARREPEAAILLADVRPNVLDSLADRLFLTPPQVMPLSAA